MPFARQTDNATPPAPKKVNDETAVFLAVIVILAVVFGYGVGKDVAQKHNRADRIAAGLAPDCGAAPKR